MAEGDRIIYSMIDSSPEGVVSIALQTDQVAEWKLEGDSQRDKVSRRWRQWNVDGKEFAGFMGTIGASGEIESIGYVLEDAECTQPFIDALGSNYTWTSPYGDIAIQPQRTSQHVTDLQNIEIERQNLAANDLAPHDHEEKAQEGLVAVTVIVWVAIIIFALLFVFNYCKQRKNSQAIGGQRA